MLKALAVLGALLILAPRLALLLCSGETRERHLGRLERGRNGRAVGAAALLLGLLLFSALSGDYASWRAVLCAGAGLLIVLGALLVVAPQFYASLAVAVVGWPVATDRRRRPGAGAPRRGRREAAVVRRARRGPIPTPH